MRTDDDSGDLRSSVGVTATMVAAARALASRRPSALIDDPFARRLVEGVGMPFFDRLVSGDLDPAALGEQREHDVSRFVDSVAVRTRYFDDFLLDAVRAGVQQVVILASGLDSRAVRLPWPSATTVFELDQREVIDFKMATLANLGIEPDVRHHAIGADLRRGWPTPLLRAGFDAWLPSVWIAEGLLGYLPSSAQDRLLENVTALCALGSRFAFDGAADGLEVDRQLLLEQMRASSARWRDQDVDIDIGGLLYLDQPTEARDYLTARGWQTSAMAVADLYVHHGIAHGSADCAPGNAYVSATLQSHMGQSNLRVV